VLYQNKSCLVIFVFALIVCTWIFSFAQKYSLEPSDPLPPKKLPEFWKSTLNDIEQELKMMKKGRVKTICTSPGGQPVYLVSFGVKEDFHSQTNYNSAVAARNPAYYAEKDENTKPVIFFVGPVHGHEMEGIVGLVNFIHILETGRDYRGRDWTSLREQAEQCRIVIIPCGNPDGRRRCPYDSFVGIPIKTMTKYGQGTRKDGTLYGWPGAKAIHPMIGDVGILGAYFNDNGINPNNDEYFIPMADETKAILNAARIEAPDIAVNLHSYEDRPNVFQPTFVPMFIKKRVEELSLKVRKAYKKIGIPSENLRTPQNEDNEFPPRRYFNLTSALHHISGTMSFTYECCDGTVHDNLDIAFTHDQILDMELHLYQQMIDYILSNRLIWKR